MVLPDPTYPTTASDEYTNIHEEHENDLKCQMRMIEAFKEEIKNKSFKETHEIQTGEGNE